MKSKKVIIYIKLEDVADLIKLETCRNREDAERKVRCYERQDRQELAEGYGFPHGITQYVITPV